MWKWHRPGLGCVLEATKWVLEGGAGGQILEARGKYTRETKWRWAEPRT